MGKLTLHEIYGCSWPYVLGRVCDRSTEIPASSELLFFGSGTWCLPVCQGCALTVPASGPMSAATSKIPGGGPYGSTVLFVQRILGSTTSGLQDSRGAHDAENAVI